MNQAKINKSIESVQRSISEIRERLTTIDSLLNDITPPPKPQPPSKSFVFDGKTYKIDHWYQLLPLLCEKLSLTQRDKSEFRVALLELEFKQGYPKFVEKRPQNYEDFDKEFKPIPGLNLYVKSRYGRKQIEQYSRRLITRFGFEPKNDFKVELI